MTPEPLRVFVATPLGRGGKGGIDRLMDGLADALAADPAPGVTVRFAATRGKGSILLSPLVLALFCARFIALRARGEVDVLHINLSVRGSTWRKIPLARLARALRVPVVLHLHGAEYHHFWDEAPPGLRRRIASLFGDASRVIVLGTVWRDLVLRICDRARPVVLMNATTARPAAVHRATGEARLLFLGRLGARKGVPELLDALERIRRLSGWSIVIAGDGEVEQTRREVAARGLSDRVSVPGWAEPDEVDALIAKAHVLVLPSHDENLPMAVIEAMAAGLAVVTTPAGALPDIIANDVNGLLVPAGDPDALADALAKLVADPALRSALGARARRDHAEKLEMTAYRDRVLAIWREAANHASGGDRS